MGLKELKGYLIKDIRKSDFYHIFKEVSKDIKVKAYDLRYLKNIRRYDNEDQTGDGVLYEHCVKFKGLGSIPWDEIANEANDIVNRTTKDDIKFNTDIFYIEFDCHRETLDCLWAGTVWLEDGSWVTLGSKYDSYDDSYVFKMERHAPPLINTTELSKKTTEYTIKKLF